MTPSADQVTNLPPLLNKQNKNKSGESNDDQSSIYSIKESVQSESESGCEHELVLLLK
jgi:hypothetical protein